MPHRIALALTLAFAAPAAAGSPIAEVVCAPRADMEARLEREFRSTLTGSGLRDADAMLQVWTDDSGRWTLVQRYASGRSCILAMGEAWQDMRPGS